MNLSDIILPNRAGAEAEKAERAESQKSSEFQSPPQGAEPGNLATRGFPPNPPNPPAQLAEIEKPLPVTIEYYQQQGVKLLPEDLTFIKVRLPNGTKLRNETIRRYIAIWLAAMGSVPSGHRKDNRGRFTANTWLAEQAKFRPGARE